MISTLLFAIFLSGNTGPPDFITARPINSGTILEISIKNSARTSKVCYAPDSNTTVFATFVTPQWDDVKFKSPYINVNQPMMNWGFRVIEPGGQWITKIPSSEFFWQVADGSYIVDLSYSDGAVNSWSMDAELGMLSQLGKRNLGRWKAVVSKGAVTLRPVKT